MLYSPNLLVGIMLNDKREPPRRFVFEFELSSTGTPYCILKGIMSAILFVYSKYTFRFELVRVDGMVFENQANIVFRKVASTLLIAFSLNLISRSSLSKKKKKFIKMETIMTTDVIRIQFFLSTIDQLRRLNSIQLIYSLIVEHNSPYLQLENIWI